MHAALQVPDSLPVHHAHLENSSRPAFSQIYRNEFAQILRPERVQVEHAINRQLGRFVTFIKHRERMPHAI